MSTDGLSAFSYEVLALVGRGGAGPHDLRLMARKGRMFAWAGESRYYTEPKRLAARGLLTTRTEPGRTHPRTVYSLTEAGLAALTAWARTPAELPALRHEGLVRVLAADLVGEEAVREGLASLRSDIAERRAELDRAAEDAKGLPHRTKYLMLGQRLARDWLDVNERWLDEVERALSGSGSA